MSFANVFLQSVACLFILMTLSIAEQKILILMKSSLSVISFMNCAFGIVSEKSSPNSRSFGLSLMLSSRSFIVLCFTLRSMIHFELIFVKGVRSVSRLIFFLHVDVQLFQHQLLKTLSFFHYIAFDPLSKIRWCIYVSLFLGCLFFSITLFVYSFADTTLSWLV